MLLGLGGSHCDSFAKYSLHFLRFHAPNRSVGAGLEVDDFSNRSVRVQPFHWSAGLWADCF